ncbi:MAG: hypothetical protein JNL21_27240 [Myxococcales bacterium]|nr:hypothetical protein [Myxococcales bacterium]
MVARSFVTSVLAALLLGSVPAVAIASGSESAGDESAVAQAKEGAKGKSKGKDAEKHFPMKSDEFSRRIENRIAKMRERVAAMLEKRKVSEAERTAALKRFDEGAGRVRGAATEAGKDGTVTLDEAKHVREIAKDERKAMRKEVAEHRKDKKGNKKGKKA